MGMEFRFRKMRRVGEAGRTQHLCTRHHSAVYLEMVKVVNVAMYVLLQFFEKQQQKSKETRDARDRRLAYIRLQVWSGRALAQSLEFSWCCCMCLPCLLYTSDAADE